MKTLKSPTTSHSFQVKKFKNGISQTITLNGPLSVRKPYQARKSTYLALHRLMDIPEDERKYIFLLDRYFQELPPRFLFVLSTYRLVRLSAMREVSWLCICLMAPGQNRGEEGKRAWCLAGPCM